MKPLKSFHLALILFVWVVVLALAGLAAMFEPPEPDNILENRFGDVNWDHDLHARKAVSSCQNCHHKSKINDDNPAACVKCHKNVEVGDSVHTFKHFAIATKDKTPNRRIAFHKKCQGCHVAMNKGPTACADCHKKPMQANGGSTDLDHMAYAKTHGLSCVQCHKENNKTEISGYRWDDCLSCHDQGFLHFSPIDNSYDHSALFEGVAGEVIWDHRQHKLSHFNLDKETSECTFCHHKDVSKDTSEELNKQNYRSCKECHNYKGSKIMANGKTAPSSKVAIHKACLKCHSSEHQGMPEKIGTSCNSCHRSTSFNKFTGDEIIWSHDAHSNSYKCVDCHHKAVNGNEAKACSDCHMETNLKDLKATASNSHDELFASLRWKTHSNCTNCHSEEFANISKKDMQSIKICSVCHTSGLKANQIQEKNDFFAKHEKLSLQNVLHKNCTDCHQKLGKGSVKDAYADYSYKQKENSTMMDLSGIRMPAASALHRVHVYASGFPCVDCHHNMKPNSRVSSITSPVMAIDKAQDCINCHGRDELGLIAKPQALKAMCNSCHSEFAIDPAIK